MPVLRFEQVSKSYGLTEVIRPFDATIEDGEFLVLLGPSGCGKSTLLRMIAGLTEITSGTLLFGGERANNWEPRRRDVAFVFQSYALYPHMSVRANIAFPLMMDAFRTWHHLPIVNSFVRHSMMKSPEIAAPTERIARQLELDGLLDRRPASLSGGQRQRVALARALVRDPSIYLLDEPLSNLDAKLRTQTRSDISALHTKVGKTFVYVTHDQIEAMTMATRIVVMNNGIVQQVDTPHAIYDQPANVFVAGFIGSPPMNLIPVGLRGGKIFASDDLSWSHEAPLPAAPNAILGIRPEKLLLTREGEGLIRAQVAVVERLGAETVLGCRLVGRQSGASRLLEHDLVFVRLSGKPQVEPEQRCALDYSQDDVAWFDAGTGLRLAASSSPVS